MRIAKRRREIGFFFFWAPISPLDCPSTAQIRSHYSNFRSQNFLVFLVRLSGVPLFFLLRDLNFSPKKKRKKREKDREINTHTEYIYKKWSRGKGDRSARARTGSTTRGRIKFPGGRCVFPFYFLHFFFVCLFGNEISKFFSRPLSLSVSTRVLFLLRRRRRRLVLLSSRYYSRGWSFIAHRGR